MRKTMLICLLLCLVTDVLACSSSSAQKQGHVSQSSGVRRTWQAATYRGLTIGRSTRQEMLGVLGQPKWSGHPEDQTDNQSHPEVWYEYENEGEFTGKLTAVIDERSDIIKRLDFYPPHLSKAEAIKHFGDDYVETRYDTDDCLGDDESAPLYESPTGQIISIEYRSRGIAIVLDGSNMVHYISYVSKPLGAVSSKCH